MTTTISTKSRWEVLATRRSRIPLKKRNNIIKIKSLIESLAISNETNEDIEITIFVRREANDIDSYKYVEIPIVKCTIQKYDHIFFDGLMEFDKRCWFVENEIVIRQSKFYKKRAKDFVVVLLSTHEKVVMS